MADSAVTVADLEIVISYRNQGNPEKQIDKVAQSANRLNKATGNATKKTNKFFASIKRIAGYRILRTVLKEITSGISQGITNLYNFSKLINGTFAKSMDKMSTSLALMQNSMAVIFAPLIENVISPLLEKLSALFVQVSDGISAFIARLKGESKYLAVNTAYTKQYAAAQRQLLGFDELNKLGSSDTLDSSKMFTYKNTDEYPTNASLTINIEDIIPNFNVSKDTLALGIVGGLVALLGKGGMVTASLGGGNLLLLGVGALVGIAIANAFAKDGGIETKEFESSLLSTLNGALGAMVGFALGGVGGAVLGATIGTGITLLLENSPEIKDKFGLTTEKLAKLLEGAFKLTGATAITLLASGNYAAGAAAMILTIGLMINYFVQDAKLSDEKSAEVLSGIGKVAETTGPIKVPTSNTSSWNSVDTSVFADLETVKTTTYDPTTKTISLHANGGIPSQGSMFIAGETGDPEFVGNVGGRTSVYNSDQLASSMASANENVVSAIYQAVNLINSAIANQPTPSIKIGDREIYQASQRGKTIVGRSLIQGV